MKSIIILCNLQVLYTIYENMSKTLQFGRKISRKQELSYLQSALHQLVEIQEGLLDNFEVMVEYPDNSLSLHNKKSLRAIATVHHSHRLPQTTQHLLRTVAVVFVFPGKHGKGKRSRNDVSLSNPIIAA